MPNVGVKLSERVGTGIGLGGVISSMGAAGAAMANVPLLDLFRNLKINTVNGAAADTDMTLTGIEPGDLILGCFGINTFTDAESPSQDTTDHMSSGTATNITISSNNSIQVDVATTNTDLVVFWVDLT